MTHRLIITARILPDGQPFKVIGRDAWALRNLVTAGNAGCTPIDHPGPRWSSYIHKLRTKHGLSIETIEEKHTGQFSGTHARYVIHSDVAILEANDRGTA